MEKLKTFSDIYNITENLTTKEKGDLFEKFTKHLFKSDPRLNNNLGDIWLYDEIPQTEIKKLKLPSRDKGIDILAKINGEYVAIQCKFRQNTDMVVPWGELGTFVGLSFGINDDIKRGYLVTNTYDVCDEVKKSNKIIAITGDFFDQLDEHFFRNIEKKEVKYIIKQPFKYQTECIALSHGHFQKNNRCCVELSCGSGKTLMSYWLDRNMHNKKTVVFVPSLQLLSQFYSDWINQSYVEKQKINYLLIGSDADVDDDICEKNGLNLTTDVKEIKSFIEKHKGIQIKETFDTKDVIILKDIIVPATKLVVICTYQSADKLIEACKDITFNFAVYDEAHKTVGQIDKQFSLTLNDDKIQIKKRCYMSATFKMYTGKVGEEKVLSMNNTKVYGEKVFCFNTGQAIKRKKYYQ